MTSEVGRRGQEGGMEDGEKREGWRSERRGRDGGGREEGERAGRDRHEGKNVCACDDSGLS